MTRLRFQRLHAYSGYDWQQKLQIDDLQAHVNPGKMILRNSHTSSVSN